MLISWKYKFLFVHVPKTGGTSMARALGAYARPVDRFMLRALDAPGLGRALTGLTGDTDPAKYFTGFATHAALPKAIEKFGEEKIAPLKKIIFVRNPFTHAYSMYAHVRRSPANSHHEELGAGSFADMLRNHYMPGMGFQRHYFSWQDDMDFIGRFETLTEDAAALGRMLALPKPLDVPHMNANEESIAALRDVYDGVLDDFVETMEPHFRFFGYSTNIDRAFEPPAKAPSPQLRRAAQWAGDKR